MDDLFRFVSVRPPQTTDAKSVSIAGRTPFQDFVREDFDEAATPAEKWRYVREAADRWIRPSDFSERPRRVITNIKQLSLWQKYSRLRTVLATRTAHRDHAFVESSIEHTFGEQSSKLETDETLREDLVQVWDSIVLIFLVPALHRNPFTALTEVAQILDIIRRSAGNDHSFNNPSAIDDALTATVILPADLLPPNTDRVRPVGIADLLVVKQHIHRYEFGEIVNIENILKGESREKVNKHGLTNDRTVRVDSTTTTETTTDLSTSERFSLKRESENTVQEDVNAKAGANISSKYGNTQFSANASFDYSSAKTDS
jgi:hypothetical protein